MLLGGPPGRRMKIQGLDIRLFCVSRVNRLWLEIISRPLISELVLSWLTWASQADAVLTEPLPTKFK